MYTSSTDILLIISAQSYLHCGLSYSQSFAYRVLFCSGDAIYHMRVVTRLDLMELCINFW